MLPKRRFRACCREMGYTRRRMFGKVFTQPLKERFDPGGAVYCERHRSRPPRILNKRTRQRYYSGARILSVRLRIEK